MNTILIYSLIGIVFLIVIGIFVFYANKNREGKNPKKDENQNSEVNYEVMVCREITEIFCNTIACLDALCGTNKSIINLLEKFLSAVSLNGVYETHQLKSLEDGIDLRIREINNFEDTMPNLKFSIDSRHKNILYKHKLTVNEIRCAETCIKQSLATIKDNLILLKEHLTSNLKNQVGIYFSLTNLKVFQYECNTLFYGCLEGMCSFPIESLKMYYEMAPQWKNMPFGVSLQSYDKSGFKMLQEMELNKASQSLHTAEEVVVTDFLFYTLVYNLQYTLY